MSKNVPLPSSNESSKVEKKGKKKKGKGKANVPKNSSSEEQVTWSLSQS